MMEWLLPAILWLAPHLEHGKAETLTAVLARESRQHQFDPLLIAAYVHTESRWRSWIRSKTEDHGLGQIHVSASTNPELIGYQKALLSPEYNLAVTASMARMWRDYHDRECTASAPFWWFIGRPAHHWLDHMKYGYRVRNSDYSSKVLRLQSVLRHRFPHRYPES